MEGVDTAPLLELVLTALEGISSRKVPRLLLRSGKMVTAVPFCGFFKVTSFTFSAIQALLPSVILRVKYRAAVWWHKIEPIFDDEEAWNDREVEEKLGTIDLNYAANILNPRVFFDVAACKMNVWFQMFENEAYGLAIPTEEEEEKKAEKEMHDP